MESAVVANDVVCGLQPCDAWGLRTQYCLGLRERRAVACLQAADLQCLVAVDDEYPVNLCSAFLDEKGDDEDLIRATRGRGADLHQRTNRRVGEGLEIRPGALVREHAGAQFR